MTDQAVVSGAALVSHLLIVGGLGIAAYGRFSMLVLVQLFLLALQQAGITGMYQVHYNGMAHPERHGYQSGIWTAELLFLGVAALGLAVAMPYFQLRIGEAVAVVLNVILLLLQDFFRRIALTHGSIKEALVMDMINNVLQLGGLCWLYVMHATTLIAVLWICGLSFIPALAYAASRLELQWDLAALRKVLHLHGIAGLWMIATAVLQWFAGNCYIVAAGWWLGAAALGVLRLGQYVFGLLNVLLQAIESYLLPRAGALAPQQLITYLRSVQVKMVCYLGALLAVVLLAVQPVLQCVHKTADTQLLVVTYGLGLVYFFVIAGYPVRIALRALHMGHIFFGGYVMNALFAICTAYFFIHWWRLNGVLAGLLLSQVLLLAFWIAMLHHKYKVL